jgi:hypothetical protein
MAECRARHASIRGMLAVGASSIPVPGRRGGIWGDAVGRVSAVAPLSNIGLCKQAKWKNLTRGGA